MRLTRGNSPLAAIRFFLTGLRWLGKAPLRPFLLVPILINLGLYSLAFTLGYHYLTPLVAHTMPTWLDWLAWLLKPLLFLGFILIGFFTFTLVANLIAAPFYGHLAEKTYALIVQMEAVDNQAAMPVMTQPHWSKVMWGELKRLGYLLKWMGGLVIISLIPGLNLLSPLCWTLFGAWGCALEFFAYPLENQGLVFQEQKNLLKNIRLGGLSFGGVVMFGLSVPVFNLFVSPAAVIAATLYAHAIGAGERPR